MRLPLINGEFDRIDKETLCSMVDLYLSKGFQYFDTAWFYHNGQSEAAIKECLVSRYPRSSFFLADKMPLVLIRKEQELEEYFQTQRERLRVDYFDYYLVHDMAGERRETAEKTHVFEFLAEKKAAGLVKHIGFSFHDTADILEQILTEHTEVDLFSYSLTIWIGKMKSFNHANAMKRQSGMESPSLSWSLSREGRLQKFPQTRKAC